LVAAVGRWRPADPVASMPEPTADAATVDAQAVETA
jgi:hypothetical protein